MTTRLPGPPPVFKPANLDDAAFDRLLTRIEDVLVVAIDAIEDSEDRTALLDQRAYLRTQTLPHYGIHDFPTVQKLERALLPDDSAPDHAAYLVNAVRGYDAWDNQTGRIQAVQAVLLALPWHRAYALAKCLDPKLPSF